MQFQRHVSHAREKQNKIKQNSLCKRARSRPPTASASPEPSSRPPPPQAYSPWRRTPSKKRAPLRVPPSKIKSLPPRKQLRVQPTRASPAVASAAPAAARSSRSTPTPSWKQQPTSPPQPRPVLSSNVRRAAPLYPATKNSNRPKIKRLNNPEQAGGQGALVDTMSRTGRQELHPRAPNHPDMGRTKNTRRKTTRTVTGQQGVKHKGRRRSSRRGDGGG